MSTLPPKSAAPVLSNVGCGGPQHARNRRPQRNPQRRDAKSQRADRRNPEREEQHVAVRTESSLNSRPRGQRVGGKNSERPAEPRSRDHQQRTLRQQLTEKMPLLRPNGHSQTKFPLPRLIARHDQQRDIGARDQQNEQHQSHQDSYRLAVLLVEAFDSLGGIEIQQRLPLLRINRAHSNLGRFAKGGLQCVLCLCRSDVSLEANDQRQAPPFRVP